MQFFYSDFLCPFFCNLISLFLLIAIMQMATAFLRLVNKKTSERVACVTCMQMWVDCCCLVFAVCSATPCLIQQDWTGKMWNEQQCKMVQVCCRFFYRKISNDVILFATELPNHADCLNWRSEKNIIWWNPNPGVDFFRLIAHFWMLTELSFSRPDLIEGIRFAVIFLRRSTWVFTRTTTWKYSFVKLERISIAADV